MEDVREKLSVPEAGGKSGGSVRGLAQVLVLALTLGFGAHAQAQINGEDIRSIVRISTNVGDFSIGLYDEATPKTVANFLGYVERGDYNQTYIHRTANTTGGGFQIVQGGAFRFIPFEGPDPIVTENTPTVENEPGFSNVRGTLAMAKLAGEPDSATSQWFVNVTDNSESLDTQNEGFTVFGEVLDGEAGMAVIDAIMDLQKVDLGARASFAPIVTDTYDGRPDEEFVFVNMEVVDRYSDAINVFALSQGLVISSVRVGDSEFAFSLNFTFIDGDTMELNVDSLLRLVDVPEGAAIFGGSIAPLLFPEIEVSAGQVSFV
jgi:peptidyl-prolyl cis-trans isomerase A (cyclophilin A)